MSPGILTNEINLAAVWPVGQVGRPVCRPDGTAMGHRKNVCDEETSIPELLRVDANS